MSVLDTAALRAGAGVSLAFAVPFSIAARWAADNDNSALAAWLSLTALIGFIVGAGVAAWLQPLRLPLIHGTACAIGTYVIAQAVFIIVKVARDRDVNWVGSLFTLTTVAVAGLIGGGLGAALQRRGMAPSRHRGGSG